MNRNTIGMLLIIVSLWDLYAQWHDSTREALETRREMFEAECERDNSCCLSVLVGVGSLCTASAAAHATSSLEQTKLAAGSVALLILAGLSGYRVLEQNKIIGCLKQKIE